MMQHMATNTNPGVMMPGMDVYTLLWIAIGVLLFLLVVTSIWLFTRWQQHRARLPAQHPAQPKDAYHDYQEGYQEQRPFLQVYEEGGRSYAYPQDEQPQAQPHPIPLHEMETEQRVRMPLEH